MLTRSRCYLLISGSILLFTPFIYVHFVGNNSTVPNPATWFIFLSVMILNLTTYYVMVRQDIYKAFPALAAALGGAGIFGYTLYYGKFAIPEIFDFGVVGIVIMITVYWKVTGRAARSNVFLQVLFLVSLIPTMRSVWLRTSREMSLPWLLAMSSYVCMLKALCCDKRKEDWTAYAYPVVRMFGNSSIALLAFWRNYFA